MATLATDTLLQTNEKKYALLRDGIPVEREMPDGTKQTEYAAVFDFEHPDANRFIAVKELWVDGSLHHCHCYFVGFVKGGEGGVTSPQCPRRTPPRHAPLLRA